ncbi:MAG: hypothetical protein M3P83_10640 [Actinomycetota bacterium]|nr:hypothetical protein [Actinomycetota bacterium]
MRLPARFNGPDGSANGGYACGSLACALAPPDGAGLQVVRRPPPLEVDLAVRDDGLYDGEHLIAQAQPAEVTGDVPRATVEQAQEAQSRHIGFVRHTFPRCFTCGPERAPGDGLRIFPGSVGDDGVVAAVWEPDPAFADADGAVDPVMLWAALDCPSGIAVIAKSDRPAVLGRLAVVRHAPVLAGRRHVVVGWPRQGAGRRALPAGSALLGEDGEVVAQAEAVWVSVDVPMHDAGAQRTAITG